MATSTKILKKENDQKVLIEGKELHLTNLNKIYFPKEKITKGDVIDYYNTMYKYILPYLKDRPESLRRTPNGIADEGLFQKDAGGDAPTWVKKVIVHAESEEKDINYILGNDRATLPYLNNLGCIDLNPWFSRVQN